MNDTSHAALTLEMGLLVANYGVDRGCLGRREERGEHHQVIYARR